MDDNAADAVTLTGGGEPLLRMPGGRAAQLIIDADLLEVVVDGVSGVGAARVPSMRFDGSRTGKS